MKLIIAYLPTEAFEQARTALLDVGVTRTTISEVRSSGPSASKTLHYRGAALETNLRSELRLECLADAEQSAAVVDVLRGTRPRPAWPGESPCSTSRSSTCAGRRTRSRPPTPASIWRPIERAPVSGAP